MRRFSTLLLASLAALMALLPVPAFAVPPDALGGSAFPLTYINQPPINLTDAFNEMLQIINAQTVGISSNYANAATIPSGGVDSSGVTFSTSLQGNPLVQSTFKNVTTAQANAGINVLASATGRTIHVTGPISMMTAGGNAAGATDVLVKCSGGSVIEQFPIATLLNSVPALSSSAIVLGSTFSRGCPSGESVQVLSSGTLTTATSLFVNVPYVVQ